jgi:hypothetical protein
VTSPENELWKAFIDHVRKRGMAVSPDCEVGVRTLISQGVGAMNTSHYSALQRQGARDKLLFFADEMMGFAQYLKVKLLDKKIFEKIKERLCPLHPFC